MAKILVIDDNWPRAKANQMDPLAHSLADLLAENQAVNEWTYK